MDFGLSDDQKMMQDSVRRTLERVASLERVRKADADKEPYAADIFNALRELGVPGILIPADYGGLELGLFEAALIAEMLGRSVTPVPFVGSAVMAPLALMGAGSDEQKSAWLPKLASGESDCRCRHQRTCERRARWRGGQYQERQALTAARISCSILQARTSSSSPIISRACISCRPMREDTKRIALTSIDRTRAIGELVFGNVEAVSRSRMATRPQRSIA